MPIAPIEAWPYNRLTVAKSEFHQVNRARDYNLVLVVQEFRAHSSYTVSHRSLGTKGHTCCRKRKCRPKVVELEWDEQHTCLPAYRDLRQSSTREVEFV